MRRQAQTGFLQSTVRSASSCMLKGGAWLAWMGVLTLAFWSLLAGPAAAKSAGAAKPQRIVSLNLCVDQILVDLVARHRIRALSYLAADPSVSAVAKMARGIAATRGEPEQVVQFNPDLVIAGTFTTKATTSLLTRLGLHVLVMPLAQDFAGIRKAVRTIANAVGEPVRGAALIADFDGRLADASRHTRPDKRPSALVYGVNGATAAPSSLAHAVLTAAGLRNAGVDRRVSAAGTLPLEVLVARPPQLIILVGAANEFRSAAADNLRHPALRSVLRQHRSIRIPRALWLCGSPRVAEAVSRLAAAARSLALDRSQR